jgi:hypothetical protein
MAEDNVQVLNFKLILRSSRRTTLQCLLSDNSSEISRNFSGRPVSGPTSITAPDLPKPHTRQSQNSCSLPNTIISARWTSLCGSIRRCPAMMRPKEAGYTGIRSKNKHKFPVNTVLVSELNQFDRSNVQEGWLTAISIEAESRRISGGKPLRQMTAGEM